MFSHGYWSTHRYFRLEVENFIEEFCGWDPLQEMLEYSYGERDKSFLAFLFETGARVGECLSLKKENFKLRPDQNLLLVKGMPNFKRYRKVSENVGENGKKHWLTERIPETRKTFPIRNSEPLVPLMLAWLSGKSEGDLLFPSPYRLGMPLTRHWAYNLVRRLDERLPSRLRETLGLNIPFKKPLPNMTEPLKVADRIHLWLHWFRSQRACQLVADYGFRTEELTEWFSWETPDMALVYSKRGWLGLAEKMKVPQIS